MMANLEDRVFDFAPLMGVEAWAHEGFDAW